MIKYLWKLIDQLNYKTGKVKIFLFFNTVLFTLLGFFMEWIICLLFGINMWKEHSSILLAIPLYLGLFLGLYGGIIFLMKHTDF